MANYRRGARLERLARRELESIGGAVISVPGARAQLI